MGPGENMRVPVEVPIIGQTPAAATEDMSNAVWEVSYFKGQNEVGKLIAHARKGEGLTQLPWGVAVHVLIAADKRASYAIPFSNIVYIRETREEV